MNHNYAYNRAHDEAHRLARRHERDLHWAKERRRQHERQIGEALLLVATKPLVLARKTLLITALLLLVIVGGQWFVQNAGPPRGLDAGHRPGRRRADRRHCSSVLSCRCSS